MSKPFVALRSSSKKEGDWKVALTAREAELGSEFIALIGVTESGEMRFRRLGREERSALILKYDEDGLSLNETKGEVGI